MLEPAIQNGPMSLILNEPEKFGLPLLVFKDIARIRLREMFGNLNIKSV
jgi:hypothetical protein